MVSFPEKAEDILVKKSSPRLAPQPALIPKKFKKDGQISSSVESILPPAQNRPPSILSSTQPDSLIAQRRTEHGTPLESGIIPTIVKNEREILFEILTEKLPYMTDREKEIAIENLLKLPPGAKRNAFLKVFLIKHKKYAKLDPILVKNQLDEKITWFIENSSKNLKGTIGFFDPFQLIENMSFKDVKYLLDKLNRTDESNLIEELILKFYEGIQSRFNNSSELGNKFGNPINYLIDFLYSDPNFMQYFEKCDVISKHELMDIFADFCADKQINVHDLSTADRFPWDLYLSKKNATNKSGIAVFLRGHEILDNYQEAIEKLNSGAEYCNWIFFITTPLGVLEIGLDKLIQDMEEIGAWVYIVDRLRGIIYGLLKGDDSSKKMRKKENELKNNLNFPLRRLDPQKQFSKYIFDKKFQYKPKNYRIFGVNEYFYRDLDLEFIERDRNNLQYLLFLHKTKGMSLNFVKWATKSLDPDLISGLISAIDSFGSTFKESKGLQEIQYGGFNITFVEGKYIKACLFLKETPSPRLKELLVFAVTRWESLFEKEIKNFSGSLQPFTKKSPEADRLLNQIFLGDYPRFKVDDVIRILPLPI
ncbi:MAG: hypothetical protein HWN65_20805 [Candidatus Helarchaeota archaeon]|nr:hypothetical protein [Candidatus Helarchaeota archaeon]